MKTNGKIIGLTCVECTKRYAENEVMYTCPACDIAGILDVEYDDDRARRQLTHDSLARAERSIWRYLPILPIADDARLPTLQIGMTPVMNTRRRNDR